ncbi:MAG: hypothetical protein JWN62_3240 [Acidimicrobiales bacterium]|nr:hypothetical protein [Acidimicrobiales bacterium]
MLPFALTTLLGLLLSSLAIAVTARSVEHLPNASRTICVQLATLSAFGVVWLLQFVLLDRITFRNHEDRDDVMASIVRSMGDESSTTGRCDRRERAIRQRQFWVSRRS